MLGKIPLKATQRRRERHMNDNFGDRLSASANAKTAKLEMAAQAKIAAETPAAIAQRAARAETSAARAARDFERKASKLATKKREAEELAALHADRVVAREMGELAEREALAAEPAGKEALNGASAKLLRDLAQGRPRGGARCGAAVCGPTGRGACARSSTRWRAGQPPRSRARPRSGGPSMPASAGSSTTARSGSGRRHTWAGTRTPSAGGQARTRGHRWRCGR